MKKRILLKLICISNQLVYQIVVVICLVSISFTHEFIIEDNSIEHHRMAHDHNRTRQSRCKCVTRDIHTRNVSSAFHWVMVFFLSAFGIFPGFPFYTIGRFQNAPCMGSNQLMGTCVLAGECSTSGGIATGSCNSITRQAVCCVCK